jgi:hypothetical protein
MGHDFIGAVVIFFWILVSGLFRSEAEPGLGVPIIHSPKKFGIVQRISLTCDIPFDRTLDFRYRPMII